MKVSQITRDRNNLNTMNLSSEFIEKSLTDQVQYKIALKNLSENNDVSQRFLNKERVVRETTSLGGFRIPKETLKKRVNPSELIKDQEFDPYYNASANNNFKSQTFQPNNSKLFGEPLIDENLPFDHNKDLGSNLIDIIDKEVEKLKKESEEHVKVIEMRNNSKLNSGPEIDENKVLTQYLAYNPERFQAIKHVATQFKPEYMSLEELQRLKEEHTKKMIQIENEFFEKKKRDEENMNRMHKMGEDRNFDKLYSMEMKHNQSRKITAEELQEIVRNEEEFIKRNQSTVNKKEMKQRSKSLKAIKRVGVSVNQVDKKLDKNEQRFVKNYANYMMKKKVGNAYKFHDEDNNDEEESWNTTKIKSMHARGIVNRPDRLPGHLDNEDYSMYYYSINSNTPRSLSIKSVTNSRSLSKSFQKVKNKNFNNSVERIRRDKGTRSDSESVSNSRANSNDSFHKSKNKNRKTKNYRNNNHHHVPSHKKNKSHYGHPKNMKANSSYEKEETYQSNKLNMNSHLAFIKLIFNLLDKEKKGIVDKELIARDLNLEENILNDLGFENLQTFKQGLDTFPTQIQGYMSEKELIALLLSRSELADEFLNNFKNNQPYSSMQEENNYEFKSCNERNYLTEHDQYEKEHPGMNNNNMEYLQYPTTHERLDKLRESFSAHSSYTGPNANQASGKSKSELNKFNISLTNNLKNKIKSKSKVKVSYKDYSDFLNKYKNKGELNFTIPKPFDFLKKDYSTKKMEKIQEILEERKRKEDEILGFRFKPNELKREIFISQFENVIEAEKTKRKYRTEKLKEKIIQDMKPFSFYEQDERKYKEKILKTAEPLQFAPFKANAVPWTSQVTMYDDIFKKIEVERQSRIEQRAMETQKSAKLPPRLEMHEKKKKQQEQEMKLFEKTNTMIRSKSFRANVVPDFTKAHESFMKTLEKKKANTKPTEPVPFNFHEPKVRNVIIYYQ
jgi:hypothetical protein